MNISTRNKDKNIKCAGIVLYNPNINRLLENFNSIRDQVDFVILIDNFSTNIAIIKELNLIDEKTILIENNENKGVAKALNQITDLAKKMNYDYVYLLDQDTISSPTIISTYNDFIKFNDVGLLTPYIVDINKTDIDSYKAQKHAKTTEVNWAITSGSLINIYFWELVGKFDEFLFIDNVDIDYSIRLKLYGIKQYRINEEYILHEVGNAVPTFLYIYHKDNANKWLWRRYYRSNHSQVRNYYMVRNGIILARKYRKYRNFYVSILMTFIYIIPKIIFEDKKISRIKIVILGIRDGFSKNNRIQEFTFDNRS